MHQNDQAEFTTRFIPRNYADNSQSVHHCCACVKDNMTINYNYLLWVIKYGATRKSSHCRVVFQENYTNFSVIAGLQPRDKAAMLVDKTIKKNFR